VKDFFCLDIPPGGVEEIVSRKEKITDEAISGKSSME